MIEVTLQLEETAPRVWRRLLMPEKASLEDLHEAVQSVTGWQDYHLYEFQVGQRRFGRPELLDDAWDPEPGLEDARGITLGDLRSAGQEQFAYQYDFGDCWDWSVTLGAAADAPGRGSERSHCVEGARAAPPEDAGGIGGYEELCAAVVDPMGEEDAELARWAPEGWHPDAFSAAAVDWVLAHRDESSMSDRVVGWMGGLPEKLTVTAPYYLEMFWSLQDPAVDTIEEAEARARRLIGEYSDRPVPELAGLTLRRYTDLLGVAGGTDRDPLTVPDDLTEEELRAVPVLPSYRAMMEILKESGPIRRTKVRKEVPAKLEYRFIGRVSAEVETGRGYPPEVRRLQRKHRRSAGRILEALKTAGLVITRQNAFRLTRRGREMVDGQRWDRMLGALIRTDLSLKVIEEGSTHPVHPLNLSLGYLLYRWSLLEERWYAVEDLIRELLPPFPASSLFRAGREEAKELFEDIYMDGLEAYGLARRGGSPDRQGAPQRKGHPNAGRSDPIRTSRWRPTPLAARVLRFRWEQGTEAHDSVGYI